MRIKIIEQMIIEQRVKKKAFIETVYYVSAIAETKTEYIISINKHEQKPQRMHLDKEKYLLINNETFLRLYES